MVNVYGGKVSEVRVLKATVQARYLDAVGREFVLVAMRTRKAGPHFEVLGRVEVYSPQTNESPEMFLGYAADDGDWGIAAKLAFRAGLKDEGLDYVTFECDHIGAGAFAALA